MSQKKWEVLINQRSGHDTLTRQKCSTVVRGSNLAQFLGLDCIWNHLRAMQICELKFAGQTYTQTSLSEVFKVWVSLDLSIVQKQIKDHHAGKGQISLYHTGIASFLLSLKTTKVLASLHLSKNRALILLYLMFGAIIDLEANKPLSSYLQLA